MASRFHGFSGGLLSHSKKKGVIRDLSYAKLEVDCTGQCDVSKGHGTTSPALPPMMNVQPVIVDVAGFEETLTSVLPNELLLRIFRFLDYDDLLKVEQACLRWKTVVETCFATLKRLYFFCSTENDHRLTCYGPSIQRFQLPWCKVDRPINWAQEIADRFPNLIKMKLRNMYISRDGLSYLSTKCCQLKAVSFNHCNFTDEGLRVFLRNLPGIKSLHISNDHWTLPPSECKSLLPPSDASPVFSTCTSLERFVMVGPLGGRDTASFSKFCKECVTLRKLVIADSDMPNEMFVQIQNCFLLEELRLSECEIIKDSALIQISKGCPNLRSVSLVGLPIVREECLKGFAKCKNLTDFRIDGRAITDETLIEFAKGRNMRKFTVHGSLGVTDRGCAALLANCPRLELLDVQWCRGVTEATVDSAIQALQCRNNGLVLQLKVKSAGATPHRTVTQHPLLLW